MSRSSNDNELNRTTSGSNSQNNERLTVIIITAGNCGACIEIKRSGGLARITSALQADGITVFNYETKNLGAKLNENDRFTSFINRKLMLWYPLFAVMPTSTVAKYNSNSNFGDNELAQQIDVFNGIYKDGRFEEHKIYTSFGPTTVKRWISDYQRKRKAAVPERNVNRITHRSTDTDFDSITPIPAGSSSYVGTGSSNSNRSTPTSFDRIGDISANNERRNETQIRHINSEPNSQRGGGHLTLEVPNHVRTFAGEGEVPTYVSCRNIGFTLLPRAK